jgi:hypothetical protein
MTKKAPDHTTVNKIVHRVSQGCRPREAAISVGIDGQDFEAWCAAAYADPPDPVCRAFVNRVEAAIQRAECDSVEKVTGADDWRAHAWYLERTRPSIYGNRQRIDQAAKDRAAAAILRELGQRLDPAVFAQVRLAIVDACNELALSDGEREPEEGGD